MLLLPLSSRPARTSKVRPSSRGRGTDADVKSEVVRQGVATPAVGSYRRDRWCFVQAPRLPGGGRRELAVAAVPAVVMVPS